MAVGLEMSSMNCEGPSRCRSLGVDHPSPRSRSRLQSLIASGEAAHINFVPLPTGGLEAKFDTQDWFGWASVAWEKLKHLTPHNILRPKSNLAEPFPDSGRIALVGDWGTGLYGAPEIARAVRNDPNPLPCCFTSEMSTIPEQRTR